MKRAALALALTAAAWGGDFSRHLAGSTLDVYVGESVECSTVPGSTPERSLVVSVKTADDSAQAIMVWVMVRLDDQTRTARTAVIQRSGDNRLVFRFPLGDRRPTELVDIRVDNLRKAGADIIAPAY